MRDRIAMQRPAQSAVRDDGSHSGMEQSRRDLPSPIQRHIESRPPYRHVIPDDVAHRIKGQTGRTSVYIVPPREESDICRLPGQPASGLRDESVAQDAPPISPEPFATAVTSGQASSELAARMTALRPVLTRFFLRSVRNQSDAEDMVQDVYLRIMRRGEMDSYEGFVSYAFLTAASVLKDRNRRGVVRHLNQHVQLDPDALVADTPGPDRSAIARDELRSTSIALARLPERTRAVFILRRLDGLSFSEIGLRLGISVSSAEKHMLKATRYLLTSMREMP